MNQLFRGGQRWETVQDGHEQTAPGNGRGRFSFAYRSLAIATGTAFDLTSARGRTGQTPRSHRLNGVFVTSPACL